MPRAAFAHVDTWVFDLDNTLYHPSAGLFAQMNPRMTAFIMKVAGVDAARADVLRQTYWRDYGTTMAGLIAEHDMDPTDFLKAVHDIDLSHLTADPDLRGAITALPGTRIVFTNGTRDYAKRVLAARGLAGAFDGVFGVEEAGYVPKPRPPAFDRVFEIAGVLPARAAMFEDEARNLAVPHELGMKTVHVADSPAPAPYIHHHTADLTAFLARLA